MATSFFVLGEGISLAELAALCGGTFEAEHGALLLRGIAALDTAGPQDLSFFDSPRYSESLKNSVAGAVIVSPRFASWVPEPLPKIVVQNPGLAFALAGQALFPLAKAPGSDFPFDQVSPQASVHPSARIEDGATVEPFAVIGPNVAIGRGTIVGNGASIGAGCQIGRDCRIAPQVTIQHAIIGNNVILHPGVRIGQDGFGYVPGSTGLIKQVQIGRVIVQDHVEIGSNSTVDRGAVRDTVIGEGTKIDNLVQIAHNVTIGRHCVIVGQVGIAGSVTIGNGVMVGGQTGFNGHVTVGDGAQIAAVSVVAGNVPAGARWGGAPARPIKEWFKEIAFLRTLAKERRGSTGDGGNDEA